MRRLLARTSLVVCVLACSMLAACDSKSKSGQPEDAGPDDGGPGEGGQDRTPCAPDPCLHGGVCWLGSDGERCDCTNTGYSGDRCEQGIDCAVDATLCGEHARCDGEAASGSCSCEAGFGDCDGKPGCETDLASATHCGACGVACEDGKVCSEGICACAGGELECVDGCKDVSEDASHCGACGQVCGADGVCSAGKCMCPGAGNAACEWGCTETGCDKPIAASVGSSHACLLLESGGVFCWGDNEAGQLGDGTRTQRRYPVRARDVSDAVQVDAFGRHTCVLLRSGLVQCWGANGAGELGDGTRMDRSVPTQVKVLESVAQISGQCARLTDGQVYCSGVDGSLVASRIALPPAISVSDAGAVKCVVLEGGSVRCWGNNYFGQLGDGTKTERKRPVTVTGVSDAAAVAVGGSHVCITRTSGAVACWGRVVDSGQDVMAATDVAGLSSVSALAASRHTCALSAGAVRCWGANDQGEAGLPKDADPNVPLLVSNLSEVTAIATGAQLSCAVKQDGKVWCWGDRARSASVNGPYQLSPKEVPGIVATSLDIGALNTCVATGTGVRCWGGELVNDPENGLQFEEDRPAPFAALPELTSPLEVSCGFVDVCGRSADQVACLSWNPALADVTAFRDSQQIDLGGLVVFGGAAGMLCGVKDGAVTCLGTEDQDPAGRRVIAAGAKQVAAGATHACARMEDGSVQCWGQDGLLGDGSTADRPTPGVVPGLLQVTDIDATWPQTCAVAAGDVWCWGQDDPLPVRRAQVNAVQVSVGAGASEGGHVCAVAADGKVWCWGPNSSGRLGDGSLRERFEPVQVAGLSDAVEVAAGGEHSCARTSDGKIWCWGKRGLVGDGVPVVQRIPEPVLAPWMGGTP